MIVARHIGTCSNVLNDRGMSDQGAMDCRHLLVFGPISSVFMHAATQLSWRYENQFLDEAFILNSNC